MNLIASIAFTILLTVYRILATAFTRENLKKFIVSADNQAAPNYYLHFTTESMAAKFLLGCAKNKYNHYNPYKNMLH